MFIGCLLEFPRQCSVCVNDVVYLDVRWRHCENPRPGLLDRQDVAAGDLELDLYRKLLALFDGVQVREPLIDLGKVPAQLDLPDRSS